MHATYSIISEHFNLQPHFLHCSTWFEFIQCIFNKAMFDLSAIKLIMNIYSSNIPHQLIVHTQKH